MQTDKLGLYIHIPYCKRKCNYCDFCSFPTNKGEVSDEYIDRLIEEILLYKSSPKKYLTTVYFGGGTPSLLTPIQMERIMRSICETFEFSSGIEISMEANPGTLTEEKATAYKALGVNRISLGLQSIHEKEMKRLGRIHDFEDFLKSYSALRNVGFDNINIDLMYGIPHQTKESFRETLAAVISLLPEHISCYGLILEDGTPFSRELDDLELPSSDHECDMYYMASEMLREAGYLHYEISNYARLGYESKHNMLYWNTDEYIGVGLAAHSYIDGVRYANTSDLASYLNTSVRNASEKTVLSNEDMRYEYAMLKLRLSDGFLLSDYQQRFGISFLGGKEDVIDRLVRADLIGLKNGRIFLTEKGFYVSNSILVEIL